MKRYNQVNLAGEYMDVVLALTLEWHDGRLKWNQYDWSNTPIRTLQVDSSDIWTPNIDLANRNHDYSPTTERHLETTIRFDGKISFKNYDTILHNISTIEMNYKNCLGKVRQYRLFRAHVNIDTDSMLYPYDTQKPYLKLQSLDFGDDKIQISMGFRVKKES